MFHEIQVSLDITPGLHFLVFSFGLSFDYLSFIISTASGALGVVPFSDIVCMYVCIPEIG